MLYGSNREPLQFLRGRLELVHLIGAEAVARRFIPIPVIGRMKGKAERRKFFLPVGTRTRTAALHRQLPIERNARPILPNPPRDTLTASVPIGLPLIGWTVGCDFVPVQTFLPSSVSVKLLN